MEHESSHATTDQFPWAKNSISFEFDPPSGGLLTERSTGTRENDLIRAYEGVGEERWPLAIGRTTQQVIAVESIYPCTALLFHAALIVPRIPRSSSKPDSENSFVRSCLPGIETRSCLVDISSFFLFILFFFSFVRFALFRSRFTIIRYNFTFEAREIDSRDRHFMT